METNIGTDDLKKELAPIAQKATAIVVRNNEEHLACVAYLKENKAAQKRIHDKLDPIVDAAHESHKQACALRNELLKPFEDGYKRANEVDGKFQREQEAIRVAEQRRLQAIEDEKARVIQERAEAAARVQREKEAEALRQAEEARRKAAEATNAKERERLRKEAEARQAEATAAALRAEAKEDKAAAVVANVVTVESKVDKAGTSGRSTWKGEVKDIAALIKAATPGSVAASFLMANDQAIDAFARSTKGQVAVNGIQFNQVFGMSVRTK